MRSLALLLCFAAAGAAEDLKADADLPAEDLVRLLGEATGTTYLYPSAGLKGRLLGGRYDFQVPGERLRDAADFLIRQCGLDLRAYLVVDVPVNHVQVEVIQLSEGSRVSARRPLNQLL